MSTITVLQDLGVHRPRFEELCAGAAPGWEVRWATGPGAVEERARGSAVVVTVNEPIGARALESISPRLVAISFTGTDHVDLAAARRLGVAVANVPDYSTASVAELAVAMIIAMLRRFVDCDAAVRAGLWREGLSGIELSGKTVGIVGTGRIGIAVARRLAAFDCRLLGWSRSNRQEFSALGGEYVQMDELMRRSDVVTLHVPLGPSTRGMVDARLLSIARPGAVLVNTARGPVVDSAALATALHEGRLAGAAIDVYDVEPVPRDHPLLGTPRTLLLPHVAFATAEALDRKASVTAANIAAFLEGRTLNRAD